MFKNKWRGTLLLALGTIAGVALGGEHRARGRSGSDPWILMHASVVNIPREVNADVADYYEVYGESLNEMPVIVLIGLGTKPQVDLVPLGDDRSRWNNERDLQVERDSEVLDGYWLEPLYPEMAISPDEGLRGDWTTSRRNPKQLRQGEGVQAFFAVSGPEGTRLPPGTYVLKIRWKDSAKDFFGIRASPSDDVVFRVKGRENGEEGRYVEDLIERHYLWACWLYKFDRAASKKEFEKAWALVQEYLRQPTPGPGPEFDLRSDDGLILRAGDEPGFWNATPRYQAMLIARWLDKRTEEFRFMQELAIKNASAKNGEIKLKMRYYHFGPAQDQLPRNQAGELVHGLNRLYEQLYGKTMRGDAVDVPPPRKHFPDREGDDE